MLEVVQVSAAVTAVPLVGTAACAVESVPVSWSSEKVGVPAQVTALTEVAVPIAAIATSLLFAAPLVADVVPDETPTKALLPEAPVSKVLFRRPWMLRACT